MLILTKNGNFSIAGHNYPKIFKDLRNLQAGDTFYLISKKDGRKISYIITEMISNVSEYDMQYIENDDDNIRKVTIITCDPGARTRFIVRAQQDKKVL